MGGAQRRPPPTRKSSSTPCGRSLTRPVTASALAAGALSPEHVDLLAAANDGARAATFADHEETLIAQGATLRRFDDADGLVDGRGASAATTFEGTVEVRATLDPLAGATFLDELNRLMEQLRRADAIVEMAIRSRTATVGGLRPRPLLTILVGEATFADVCELATGTVVAPGQLVPLLSEADIERIVFDGPNRVIDVSRKRRFTGAVRRAIEVRDRHCQHPSGCDEPASRCDVDHVIPHSHGGVTSEHNGRLRCWPHNRIDHLRNAGPPAPPATDAQPHDQPDDRAPPDVA